jgi:hypothetical protein
VAAWVQSQVSLCGISGGQNSTGAGFLQVIQLPLLLPPNDLCIFNPVPQVKTASLCLAMDMMETLEGQEGEEGDVSICWMTLRKQEDAGI